MTQLEIIRTKIYTPENLKRRINGWRLFSKTIVFTNGCFDILHRGHIEYLAKAKDLGDFLIVGLNTDTSVRRIKGNGRPIMDEQSRALVMAALHFVDAITFFDEDTPYELIKMVKPDVLVKGGDYTEETIVGADIVKNHGGRIVTIDIVPGFSTTAIINKLTGNC
jgi:rfaE bifunctional protein nucleotidyltransferase chain/domain